MKFVVLLAGVLLATGVQAEMYKCVVNGKTAYQELPCQNEKEQSTLRIASGGGDSSWQLMQEQDYMTDRKICVIESPRTLLGMQGDDFLFASLRITMTKDGAPVVGIYSSSPLSRRESPPAFHNDVTSLGMRVNNEPFVAVTDKGGQRVLGFGVNESKGLVDQMSKGGVARVRVRFWPYDKTFDGIGIPLIDFNRAFSLLRRCAGVS